MEAPREFLSRLKRDHPDLRIRWSKRRGEWHIEQQVGRASMPPFRIAEEDDSMLRARDGYDFVMSVRPGDRMPCPIDGTTLRVPVMATGEVVCPICKIAGREGRYRAAYFPLNDMLLDHLWKISPQAEGARRAKDEQDRNDAAIVKAKERDSANHIEAATKDAYTSLVGIQSVGYTGKEFSAP